MAKFTVDTTNKLFIAKAGVTEYDVQIDLYSDAKEHWLAGGVALGFTFPFITVGGEDINPTAGTSVPLYSFLTDGWRIRPDEADHTVNVSNGVLLVDGGGDPFVDTLGAFTVRINYQQPVQAITVGGLSISQIRAAVWDEVDGIEAGLTQRESFRLMAAALLGKASGLDTTTAAFRAAVADSKVRITATVDEFGNRTLVITDAT
jgi:hypothetical protein